MMHVREMRDAARCADSVSMLFCFLPLIRKHIPIRGSASAGYIFLTVKYASKWFGTGNFELFRDRWLLRAFLFTGARC